MNNHRLISTKSVQSPNEAQNRNHHFNVSFQKIMKSSTKVKKMESDYVMQNMQKHSVMQNMNNNDSVSTKYTKAILLCKVILLSSTKKLW
jgi:hypothetical protein